MEAQSRAREILNTYDFAFRRRYNLPPTDPRYLNATREEMAADYWAHWYFEHPDDRGETFEDPDFDLEELKRKSESGELEWEDI